MSDLEVKPGINNILVVGIEACAANSKIKNDFANGVAAIFMSVSFGVVILWYTASIFMRCVSNEARYNILDNAITAILLTGVSVAFAFSTCYPQIIQGGAFATALCMLTAAGAVSTSHGMWELLSNIPTAGALAFNATLVWLAAASQISNHNGHGIVDRDVWGNIGSPAIIIILSAVPYTLTFVASVVCAFKEDSIGPISAQNKGGYAFEREVEYMKNIDSRCNVNTIKQYVYNCSVLVVGAVLMAFQASQSHSDWNVLKTETDLKHKGTYKVLPIMSTIAYFVVLAAVIYTWGVICNDIKNNRAKCAHYIRLFVEHRMLFNNAQGPVMSLQSFKFMFEQYMRTDNPNVTFRWDASALYRLGYNVRQASVCVTCWFLANSGRCTCNEARNESKKIVEMQQHA